jgi:glycosyltransferase involved in cell wall biosynthesis
MTTQYPIEIQYITNLRIPTKKAYGFQIVQLVRALASKGARVYLSLPYRSGLSENPFTYYGVSTDAVYSYIGHTDPFLYEGLVGGRISFYLSKFIFLWAQFRFAPPRTTYIYTRDVEIAWLYALWGYKTFYNAHNFPASSWLHIKLLSRVTGVVANSEGTAYEYRSRMKVPVCVLPNGVELERFTSVTSSKGVLRATFELPQQVPLVMYTGHLYAWKGVDVVLEAARILPAVTFVLIGGLEKDIEQYRELVAAEGLKNVLVLGHKPVSDIPSYLKAADVLLLPNSATSREGERYTSPLKLFEYMAAEVPLLASDLSSLREILTDDTAEFFTPDSAPDCAEKISQMLTDTQKAQHKADMAYKVVQENYTWDKAAEKLIEFMA